MATSDPIIIPPTAGSGSPVSITFVSSGMAGSALAVPDVGIYSFPSQIGLGVVGLSRIGIRTAGLIVAGSGAALGWQQNYTLVASANNDTLRGIEINLNTTPGALTGLAVTGLLISGFSVAAFTAPADPHGIEIDAINGTGAVNAVGLFIAPPAGATNNYLIAHSTPTTFNVTSAGLGTFGAGVTVGGGISAANTIVKDAGLGLVVRAGTGATFDFQLASSGGIAGGILNVPTGTLNVVIPNGTLTVSGLGGGGGLFSVGAVNSGGAGFRQVLVPN